MRAQELLHQKHTSKQIPNGNGMFLLFLDHCPRGDVSVPDKIGQATSLTLWRSNVPC